MNKFDYDLNIFQQEKLVINRYGEEEWEYQDPWFVHIYDVVPGMHNEVGVPIELTQEEADSLINSDPYFDNEPDTWYGLEGFMRDKWDQMSDRLKAIFEGLPKYREEVLF